MSKALLICHTDLSWSSNDQSLQFSANYTVVNCVNSKSDCKIGTVSFKTYIYPNLKEEMSDNLSLISKDHNTIVVESKVALASPVIWETVEMYEKAGRKCEFIPLPCKGEALRRIMTWIEYHQV